MEKNVDEYLINGCGRCKYYATENCKVNPWRKGLSILRDLALVTGLEECIKWGVPCYMYNGKNVFMIAAFRNYFCISFFKGIMMDDPGKILTRPGENTQTARLLKFNDLDKVEPLKDTILAYMQEAMEIEKSDTELRQRPRPEDYPTELELFFNEHPEYEVMFKSLSSSKRRGYILYINQGQNPVDRIERVEKLRKDLFLNYVFDGKKRKT